MTAALGCIADDYTGGTDVAAALRRTGLRTALLFDAPEPRQPLPECDAVVVALKTRTIPAADAVAASLAVRDWMKGHAVARLYVKYCSTFDSTDKGNIGPVIDALLDAAGGGQALICPAAPEHGRTVYRGHLFVGDALLSDSPMRHHPLTPMTDANLVRVLGRQTAHPVALLGRDDQARHLVADAVDEADLDDLAHRFLDTALLTGGAGLAGALGRAIAGSAAPAPTGSLPTGPGIALAGSCSAATLAQVDHARSAFASFRLDPDVPDMPAAASRWLSEHAGTRPVLVYSSVPPGQQRAGAADLLERTLGELATLAVANGVRRIVVAGGETSGAVVTALGIRTVIVAHEEDRGVPWCLTTGDPPLALLLKSGNFGPPDLLVRALKEAR